MIPNFERYQKDFSKLLDKANKLHISMQFDCFPEETAIALNKELGDKAEEMLKGRMKGQTYNFQNQDKRTHNLNSVGLTL